MSELSGIYKRVRGMRSKGLFRLQAIVELFSNKSNDELEEEVDEIPVEQLGEDCGFSYKKYSNIFSDRNIERAESSVRNKTLEESFSIASPEEEEFERTAAVNAHSSNILAKSIKRLKVLSKNSGHEHSFGFKTTDSDSDENQAKEELIELIPAATSSAIVRPIIKPKYKRKDKITIETETPVRRSPRVHISISKDTATLIKPAASSAAEYKKKRKIDIETSLNGSSKNLDNSKSKLEKSVKRLKFSLDQCPLEFKDTILYESDEGENQDKESIEPTASTSTSAKSIGKPTYKRKKKIPPKGTPKNLNNSKSKLEKSVKRLKFNVNECSFEFKDTILDESDNEGENQVKESIEPAPTTTTSTGTNIARPLIKPSYKRKDKTEVEIPSKSRKSLPQILNNSKSKDTADSVVSPIPILLKPEYKKKDKCDVEILADPSKGSAKNFNNSKSKLEKEEIVRPVPMTWLTYAYKGLRHYF